MDVSSANEAALEGHSGGALASAEGDGGVDPSGLGLVDAPRVRE